MNLREETMETCTEALMEYWEGNLTDLKDVAELLETQGADLTQAISQKLYSHIAQVVEREHLCPHCLRQLETLTTNQQLGYYGSAPYYEPVVVARICPSCHYREDV